MGLFDDLLADPPGASAQKPSLDPHARDYVIRTVLGEAANEPDDGQAAVAAVIRNRRDGGKYGPNATNVVLAPGQFEPWMTKEGRQRMMQYPPDSPAYQKAGAAVDRVFGEGYDPTNGATHFFSPTAQAALGRQAPSWAQGDGQPIGRHTFYAPEGRARLTDVSAQSRQPARIGLFDDLLPVTSPQETSPPATAEMPDTGGRFSDNPGQSFRTAREGESPAAEPPKSIVDKLVAIWENPPKDKLSLVGMIKAAYEGATLPGDVAAGKVSVTGDDGRTNPEVIQRSANLAAASPLRPAPGGMMATNAPRAIPAPSPALEANVAAQNIGVDLPKAIGTDSTITRFMGQVANKMPGGGPMQERVATAVRQTGDAVTSAAEKAGGAVDPMAAGQAFKAGIETSFKPTLKKRISEAYDEIDKYVDANATRPLVATQRSVDDIVARRVASGEADPGKAVKTVLGGVERPDGLTYAGVKDLRTRVGEMLDTGVFPEGMSQGELRRIYGALSDDLKATVTATGGEKGIAAFNRANAMNKFAEEWKDNLGKVLGSDRSGEGINAAILRMASNGSAGDLKALTMARAAVPREAWQDIASTAVSRLGLDRKGDFSPAIFLNDFAKLSDRGKTLLFKDVGSGDVLPHLNNIAAVSQKFVEAGKLANTSGTAGHGTAITAIGAGGVGFLTGSLVEPLTAISAVVGNNLMARALSKPASAAAVARWSRSYEALAKEPSPRSFAALNIASRNLANTVNSELGARVQPGDFIKAIQGPSRGAAENDQQN